MTAASRRSPNRLLYVTGAACRFFEACWFFGSPGR
jgi:hypothetical protein